MHRSTCGSYPPTPPLAAQEQRIANRDRCKCSETVQNDIGTSTSTAHDLDPSLVTSEDDLDPPCPPLDHP